MTATLSWEISIVTQTPEQKETGDAKWDHFYSDFIGIHYQKFKDTYTITEESVHAGFVALKGTGPEGLYASFLATRTEE